MAKIIDYSAPSGVPFRPDETSAEIVARQARFKGAEGQEAGRAIGQGLSNIGNTANVLEAQAEQHQTMSEIGAGAATSAKMHDAALDNWNQTSAKANINDPTVGSKFLASYEDQLAQWQGQFTTPKAQEWALSQADNMRNHMFNVVHADMGNRAADAAVVNTQSSINSYANTAYKDPSFYETGVQQLEQNVEAQISAGGLPPDAASKLRTEAVQKGKEQIARSTVLGMIDSNPAAAAKELLTGNRFDGVLSSADVAGMVKSAQVAERMQQAQSRADAADSRRQASENFNSASATVFGSLIQPDGSLKVPDGYYQSIAKLAASGGPVKDLGALESLVNAGRAVESHYDKAELAQSDATTKSAFAQRLQLDPSDPNALSHEDVFKAWADNKITRADLGTFDEALKNQDGLRAVSGNPLVKNELNKAATMIQGGLDGTNGAVRGQIAQFRIDTLRNLAAAQQQGQDIRPYLDPHSPLYAFTPERIMQYQPSTSEMASHIMQAHVIQTKDAPTDRSKAILDILRPALGNLPPPGGH